MGWVVHSLIRVHTLSPLSYILLWIETNNVMLWFIRELFWFMAHNALPNNLLKWLWRIWMGNKLPVGGHCCALQPQPQSFFFQSFTACRPPCPALQLLLEGLESLLSVSELSSVAEIIILLLPSRSTTPLKNHPHKLEPLKTVLLTGY